MTKHGPNMTKLIIRFMAREAIPPRGGIADGLEFFKNPEHRKEVMAKAEANAIAAIQLIKAAPDNPFGDNDEEIAGILLKKIGERAGRRQADELH